MVQNVEFRIVEQFFQVMRSDAGWRILPHVCFRFLRYVGEPRFVPHNGKPPRLLVHRTWSLDGGIDELANEALVDCFMGKFTDGTASVDRFFNIHEASSGSRRTLHR